MFEPQRSCPLLESLQQVSASAPYVFHAPLFHHTQHLLRMRRNLRRLYTCLSNACPASITGSTPSILRFTATSAQAKSAVALKLAPSQSLLLKFEHWCLRNIDKLLICHNYNSLREISVGVILPSLLNLRLGQSDRNRLSYLLIKTAV